MALTITVEHLPQYLKLTVLGTWVLDDILRLVETVRDLAEQAGCSRILADIQGVEGNPQAPDRYDAGRHIAMFLQGKSLAVVARIVVINHLAEMVARSRGANMLVFSSEEDALRWLLAEPDCV